MHEASIAVPLLRLVLEEAHKHEQNGQRLTVARVAIRAGVLSGIDPRTLQGIFALLAEGTAAEGAELAVDAEPLLGSCPDCGKKVQTSTRHFFCPECQGENVDWRGGNALYVAAIDVRPAIAGGSVSEAKYPEGSCLSDEPYEK